MERETFDFVVTGAWARRGAPSPRGYPRIAANWRSESEPVVGLNGRTSYQPRGKMLGGTSSLNGMAYSLQFQQEVNSAFGSPSRTAELDQ